MKAVFVLLFVIVLFSCKKEDQYKIQKSTVSSVDVEDTVQVNTSIDLKIIYYVSGCDEIQRLEKNQDGKQIEFTMYIKTPLNKDCVTGFFEKSLIEPITFTETGLYTLVFNDGELVKEIYVE